MNLDELQALIWSDAILRAAVLLAFTAQHARALEVMVPGAVAVVKAVGLVEATLPGTIRSIQVTGRISV